MTTGLGAWSFGYYQYEMKVPNDRVAHGVIAFKRALIDNGFATGINPTSTTFGRATRRMTKAFQQSVGVLNDGVIGPTTARCLFRHYAYQDEVNKGIPGHLLIRLGGAESGHDPVAQGYTDPGDEGWAQIHLSSHPSVTIVQAWTPTFAVGFAANGLYNFCATQVNDFEGAVAAWNIGQYYAKKWVLAGKPSHGLFVNGIDIYARAYNYVHAVESQPA